MEIKVFQEGQEVKDTTEIQNPPLVIGGEFEKMAERAVCSVFGMDTEAETAPYMSKIETLMEYVKSQTTDLSPENVKWIIRDLDMKAGSPPFGENRINYVARLAYLENESRKINKERTKFLMR